MATKTLEVLEPETGKKTTFGAMLTRISKNLRDSIIRQLEAGSDWDVIEKDKMYLKDHPDKTFKEWAEYQYATDFQSPYKTVRELIDYSRIYKAILAAKPDDTDVPLPNSLSQMKPLRSYEPLKKLVRSTGRVRHGSSNPEVKLQETAWTNSGAERSISLPTNL